MFEPKRVTVDARLRFSFVVDPAALEDQASFADNLENICYAQVTIGQSDYLCRIEKPGLNLYRYEVHSLDEQEKEDSIAVLNSHLHDFDWVNLSKTYSFQDAIAGLANGSYSTAYRESNQIYARYDRQLNMLVAVRHGVLYDLTVDDYIATDWKLRL